MSDRRRGLGRGLDALIEPRAQASELPIEELKPNRNQPRTDFDATDLSELADSIRAQGVVQPIVVTPSSDGRYTIIAGERRYRAAGLAGLTEVPVVIREGVDERGMLEMALVENLQRSDLNALEEAEAYRALQERFGLSQEEVAERVGKSRPTVANSLRLLKLEIEVQELLRTGLLTAGQARPLLGLDAERQVALARRVVKQGINARRVEEMVKGGARKRRPPVVDVHTAHAQEELTRTLQTKVEIRRRGKGGSVRIHFYSEEELMRLYDLLIETPPRKS
jgi:ParB family chromosome partitioning protein